MSQQGERPAAHEDGWWRRLYDETAPDTGPSSAADSLDDRFGSASDAVGPPAAGGTGGAGGESDTGGASEAVGAGGAGGASGAAAVPVPDPRAPEADPAPRAPAVPPRMAVRPPWEPPSGPPRPRSFPAPAPPVPPEPPAPVAPPEPPEPPAPVAPPEPSAPRSVPEPPADPRAAGPVVAPRPVVGHVGDRPPTYDAEPVALPASSSHDLDGLVPDTVLDGARYGTYTLRAASVRGDSARFRGEPRRDALLTARFGAGDGALVLVVIAGGARAADRAHLAAADACRWIGAAVGRSHARLSEDIRAGRRGDLKSGLHRLTDRTYGKLRARAAELRLEPDAYTVGLRCLLLPADPLCRTRVFFGVGAGGLFRLRDGAWQDLEPPVPEGGAATGEAVVGFGSAPADGTESEQGPDGDRLTMDLQIATPPSPYIEGPVPPPAEPFRFRASVARPGDTLLLCGNGLAEPMRGEPALAGELAGRWGQAGPPGLAGYLADTQLRIKGYADDRTSAAVWEA